MHEKLDFQADRIETVLRTHRISARVTGGTVTPRWVRFQVLPAVGTRISKIRGLSEELAAALNTSNCRVARRGAALDVEIPRDDPQPVRLLPLYDQLDTDEIPPTTAILGLAGDGAPLLIRLPSPDVAHVLVAGTTGSGKTVLLRSIVLSLAMTNRPSEMTMLLVDPRGKAFQPFDGSSH
ncbi:MAG: DNA translocase FtsK, partial [Anaerolineae bacterium]